ncbi:MAG: hypothetical protein ACYC4I_02375 [Minisyncoccota bacterium]
MGFEGKERPPFSFDQAIEKGMMSARDLIKKRFEQAATPEGNLEYHNTRHTESVIRRTKEILTAIARVQQDAAHERLEKLGELAAAWHDTVQEYEVVPVADGVFTKKILKRFVIKNEHKSAEEAVEFMRSARGAFSDEDEELVRSAIEVTIPDFSPEKGVMQPNLTSESTLVARAVALADLGAAGMDGPEHFLPEGDAIFREDNVDISEALHHPEDLSDEQKAFFKSRMIGWSEGQEKFAITRKANLDAELEGLSEEEQVAVKNLFNTFDESIEGARAQTERRKEMSFEDLARDFGYKV